MDKPKVNVRAWKPLDKRNKETITWNMEKELTIPSVKPTLSKKEPTESLLLPIELLNQNTKNEKQSEKKSEKKDENILEKEHSKPKYDIEIDEQLENRQMYNDQLLPRNSSKRKRNSSHSNLLWLKTFAAGVSAIATGLLFGWIVLQYFVYPMMNGDAAPTTPPINEISVVNNPEQNQGAIALVPEQFMYMIQAGVFSDQTGAQNVINTLVNKGKVGVVTNSAPYRVFMGIAIRKENADKLKEILTESGMEAYVKEYVIPAFNGNMSKQTAESFTKWINTGEQLVILLTDQSVKMLTNLNEKVEDATIIKSHQEFINEGQVLTGLLTQHNQLNEQNIVQKMTEQMNYAITALNAYKKNPNPQYAWKIQEALMNYKMNYQSIFPKVS
ncbi:SPOR domain-containing protein [Tepidibacillus infernus]|uniref:SPOR domain-containing protein n=1 Tax=Tepidibacillus infernus TaxID=1806172 RepID=UPI003B743A56